MRKFLRMKSIINKLMLKQSNNQNKNSLVSKHFFINYNYLDIKNNYKHQYDHSESVNNLEMSFQDPLNMGFVQEDSSLHLDSSKSLHLGDISTISMGSSYTNPNEYSSINSEISFNVSKLNTQGNKRSDQQDEDESIIQMLDIMKNDQKKNTANLNNSSSIKYNYEFNKKRGTIDQLSEEMQRISFRNKITSEPFEFKQTQKRIEGGADKYKKRYG